MVRSTPFKTSAPSKALRRPRISISAISIRYPRDAIPDVLEGLFDSYITRPRPAGIKPQLCKRRDRGTRFCLSFHQTLEAAIDHPLAVERRLPLGHFRQPRVLHHLGVDLVALCTRLVGDPGEHDNLTRLQLDAARERSELADLDVVSDPFAIIQRAVFAPDLAALLRKADICIEIFLRHGDDEAIDVGHKGFLRL